MLQNMDELKITIDGIFIQCKIRKTRVIYKNIFFL